MAPDSNGTGMTKSFKDVLQGTAPHVLGNIKYDHGNFQGSPALFISDEDMESLAKPFALTLVGKFSTTRPPLATIRKFVTRMKFTGSVMVDVHDNLNVIFRFSEEGDYNRVFLHRYYTVFGVYMKIVKWSPFYDISVELPIVPLWINFPGLRLQLFDNTTLLFLGNMFGKPISVDASTATCGNISKARILVEIDVTKPIPNRIWNGSKESGFFQSVVVENKPLYCDMCKIFGHVGSCCSADPLLNSLHNHNPGVVEGSGTESNPPRTLPLLITMGNDVGLDRSGNPSDNQNPSVLESYVSLVDPLANMDGTSLEEVEIVNHHPVLGDMVNGGVKAVDPSLSQSSSIILEGNHSFIYSEKDNASEDNGISTPNFDKPMLVGEPLTETRIRQIENEKYGMDQQRKAVEKMDDHLVLDSGRESRDENICSSPKSATAEEEYSMENNSLLLGYPTPGITTRSRSKLSDANHTGKKGGGSATKNKPKKGKNKLNGAMAIVLDALLYPPIFYV